MKVIYIASPYTLGNQATNVARQKDAAHKILDLGHCPIAPLLSHYLHIHKQRPYEDWLEMDLALVAKADMLLRLPGESSGADIEVALALKLKIPVLFGWGQLIEGDLIVMKQIRTINNECYTCQNKRSISGDAHINCAAPDHNMTGHAQGIKRGWFNYPYNFDPTWKTRMCDNYKEAA